VRLRLFVLYDILDQEVADCQLLLCVWWIVCCAGVASCLLEVVFEALDPATMSFSLTAPMARRIGGPLQQKPGLLLDARCGSCCLISVICNVLWCGMLLRRNRL
jgi:hypothetical protein